MANYPYAMSEALRQHRGRRIALVLVTVLALLLGGGVLVFNRLGGNITALYLDEQLGTRPTKAPAVVDTDAFNVLVMGSDARAGQGSGFGDASRFGDSARSDTTILVHVYKGRREAIAVSIPRDLMVTLPECTTSDGRTFPSRTTKFNTAFSQAGPACTIKTVESLTGIFIDHYVVVDFKGFERIVDAIGGVDVCLTEAVSDRKSHLDLPAGVSTVTGEQALAFVRARYSLGDGSDISRIRRQQDFLASLAGKVMSKQVLLNPVRLYGLLDAVTGSLGTDPALANTSKLRELAISMRNLRMHNVRLVTSPFVYGGGGVLWTAKTEELWTAIRADAPWPAPATPGPDGNPLTRPTDEVRVEVVNASGLPTAGIVDALTAQGYDVVEVRTKTAVPAVIDRTSIAAGEAGLPYARTLAASLGLATITNDGDRDSRTVLLTVGSDWRAPKPIVVNPDFADAERDTIYGPSAGRTATQTTCSPV